MKRSLLALGVLLGLGALAPSATASERALPPHASAAVKKLLSLSEPLSDGPGGHVWLSATIAQDKILVTARRGDDPALLSVTLLHPEGAAPQAQRVGGLALSLAPGPAPPELLALVTRRLEASDVTLPWVVIEAPPSVDALLDGGMEAGSPGSHWHAAGLTTDAALDFTAVDAMLDDGASASVRRALAAMRAPDDPMSRAGLALRWRLAGDPGRAAGLVRGQEAERARHEIVALRLAAGARITVADALEAIPEAEPCGAAPLATLLRHDRAFAVAAALAQGIARRAPGCVAAVREAVLNLELSGQRAAAERALAEAKARLGDDGQLTNAEAFLLARSGDLIAARRIQVRTTVLQIARRGLGPALRDLAQGWLDRLVAGAEWFAEVLVNWPVQTRGLPPLPGAAAEGRPSPPWCPSLPGLPCLRHVPSRTFMMGAQSSEPEGRGYDPEASADEGPVREVTVGALHAHEREVDARSYRLCVQSGGCALEDVAADGGYFNYGQADRGEHPMNGVSWRGAQRFCAWIGARLPTEAEWESLARGTEGRRFPWGETAPRCDVSPSAPIPQGCPRDGTSPPGLAETRSPAHLAAMGGGVWEWVADWYGPYDPGDATRPTGPEAGTERVQRGGAWTTEVVAERRGSFRASMPPDARLSDVGFRCVRDAH